MAGGRGLKQLKDTSVDEVYRAAAAILPRLVAGTARVERVTGQHGNDTFRLATTGKRKSSSGKDIDPRLVDALISHRFLTINNGAVVISDEAHMWLRRRKAGVEPFLEQHQIRALGKRDINGAFRPVVINEGESPLGWLRRRKDRDGTPLLSGEQFEAGERLRSDFERAQLRPGVTSNWDGLASTRRNRRPAPDSAAGIQDSVIESRRRVEDALAAVGPELAGILIDVCCHLTGLSETERSNGWPQRSGKVILQMALSRLARHYGIGEAGTETDGRRSARITHWGAEGFRPSLDEWND